MPGIFLLDGEAEPFEAIEVFANSLSAFVGDFAFELGGDLNVTVAFFGGAIVRGHWGVGA